MDFVHCSVGRSAGMYAVVTCRDVHFEDLTVRCKRTDNRCPILSSLSAPDGNQQGPCMAFLCVRLGKLSMHYMYHSITSL